MTVVLQTLQLKNTDTLHPGQTYPHILRVTYVLINIAKLSLLFQGIRDTYENLKECGGPKHTPGVDGWKGGHHDMGHLEVDQTSPALVLQSPDKHFH